MRFELLPAAAALLAIAASGCGQRANTSTPANRIGSDEPITGRGGGYFAMAHGRFDPGDVESVGWGMFMASDLPTDDVLPDSLEFCGDWDSAHSQSGLRDVGAHVSLTAPGVLLTVPKFEEISTPFYVASLDPDSVRLDELYDVSLPGSGETEPITWKDALRMPREPTIPATIAFDGGDATLAWEPAGADAVLIRVDEAVPDQSGTVVTSTAFSCWAEDDGSFTIPSARIGALTSTAGTLWVEASTVGVVVLDDHDVLMQGNATVRADWTR